MQTKQTTGKVTLANLISIVGIVLLLVFSFLGRSYTSGGELGWDLVVSISLTSFTALLLWFLVKAKVAENNLEKWKKVEYAVLAVYIIFAIPTSLFGGIMHFFVVNDQKELIKDYAKSDLELIDMMFEEYKEFESEAVSKTGTGLANANRRGQLCDESLNDFMDTHHIAHNTESAANYETIQRNMLLGSGFSSFYDSFTTKKNEIISVIDSWSLMQIPFKAQQIKELAESSSAELSKRSAEAELPYIVCGSNGRYTIKEDNQSRDFSVDVDSFEFQKHLQEASGFSLLALFIVLLIHFLILFNYLVAYRTRVVRVVHKEEDGGRLLYNN